MIWPFRRRDRDHLDERADALDCRLEDTEAAVAEQAVRVQATVSRAERAAARRRRAIEQNSFSQLFDYDLGRHHP